MRSIFAITCHQESWPLLWPRLFRLAVPQGKPAPETAVTATPARAPVNTENHRRAALRLFAVMDMQRMMDLSMDTMLAAFSKNPRMASQEGVFRDFLKEHLSWKSMEEEMLSAYVQAYTQRELEDITAFYETPTGKKSLSVMPELMSRGIALAQARMNAALPELRKRIDAQKASSAKPAE